MNEEQERLVLPNPVADEKKKKAGGMKFYLSFIRHPVDGQT